MAAKNSTHYPYLVDIFGLKVIMRLSLRQPVHLLQQLEATAKDYFENFDALEMYVNDIFDVSKSGSNKTKT